MIWRAFALMAVLQFYPTVDAASSANISGLFTTFGNGRGLIECENELNAQIAQTELRIGLNSFNDAREFEDYKRLLHAPGLPDMTAHIQNLPAGAVWLDLGAGKAYAQRNFLDGFYQTANAIRYVALSFAEPDDHHYAADLKKYAGQFRFIETGFLEEAMVNPSHPIAQLNDTVDFLTQVWGPDAYMRDVSQSFEFIANVLKLGGQARLLLGFQTTFYANGREMSLVEAAEALANTTGGRLRLVAAKRRSGAHSVAIFEKVHNRPVTAPTQFKLTEFWDGGPPTRVFELVQNPGVSLAQ